MAWNLAFEPSAARQLAALDPPIGKRIRAALRRLARDPQAAPNVIAMTGGGYRLRVGDWRVIYTLHADTVVILVLRIAHRREAYR